MFLFKPHDVSMPCIPSMKYTSDPWNRFINGVRLACRSCIKRLLSEGVVFRDNHVSVCLTQMHICIKCINIVTQGERIAVTNSRNSLTVHH